MKWFISGLILIFFLVCAPLLYFSRTVTLVDSSTGLKNEKVQPASTNGAASSTTATTTPEKNVVPSGDLPFQPQLVNPPSVMRGIYLTGWIAGSDKRVDELLAEMKQNNLNTVVVDIKDYSGLLSYPVSDPKVKGNGADVEPRIAAPEALIKKLHDNNIYVIGRITVFQDPILAKSHPEWALRNKTTGGIWKDQKGLAWMDPDAPPVWDYVIAIARDAVARGFDEVNFDYVRFASDGETNNISYPYWDGKSSRSSVITKFFAYLRGAMPDAKLSADLFGLATVNKDDLGIGQIIESAYRYFDVVSPMVYPSHYAIGFLGYKNPANYPYEVIAYSLTHAATRLSVTEPSSTTALYESKLRPWLQDFDLGATYTHAMVDAEVKAVEDTLDTASSSSRFGGWLLWDPRNIYRGYMGGN